MIALKYRLKIRTKFIKNVPPANYALSNVLNMHKLLNGHENNLGFEHVTLMEQIICTRRQINFEILNNNNSKIGLNTTANKPYSLS